MSDPVQTPPGPLTLEAFRRWAEQQAGGRYELSAGAIVAMAPERVAHTRAKMRAWLLLRNAILAARLPCEAFGDGISVAVDELTSYEPDVVVNCGEPADPDAIAAPRPLVVVEVTSPSNSRVDLTTKLADYFRVPTIRHYLILHLARRVVIHHRRR
ncbi:MAG: Uma2 family endonuclease, partial [Acetobacteraceae bacterium]|nr:Uma2 family endonuclease [Acetobacteraceae bacterium]